MESHHVLSHAYYPIMKGLRNTDVIMCYFVFKNFRYFAKEWIRRISFKKWHAITRLFDPSNKIISDFIKDFNDNIDWDIISNKDLHVVCIR